MPREAQRTKDRDLVAPPSFGLEHSAFRRRFLRRWPHHPLCLLLLFTLFVRGGVLLLTPGALAADPDGYRRLAENLVACGTFGNGEFSPRPLAGEGPGVRAVSPRPLGRGAGVRAADAVCSPTAYRPPLYPLLLTACVACGEHARLAIGVLHVGLGLATVWLAVVLGRWWGLSDRGAAAAGLLVACDPILLAQSTQVMTETPAALLAVVGLLALTRLSVCHSVAGTLRVPSAGERHTECACYGSAALAGAALALGVLCRPEFLLWLIVAGAVLWLQRRVRAPMSLAAFALGAAIVLGPWAIRNQIQFGRPIVTTTHGGYTLLLANNTDFYQWLRSGPWGSVWHGDRLDAAWREQRPSDELQADRLAYQEAWATIRRQPAMFAYACLVRLGRLWSPLPHRLAPDESAARRWSRYTVAVWYVAEFLLAVAGLWRMARSTKYGVRSTEYGVRSTERLETAELLSPSSSLLHSSSFILHVGSAVGRLRDSGPYGLLD